MIWRLPATRCLETSLRLRLTPGSVTVTVSPGPITGVSAAARASASRLVSSRRPSVSARSWRRWESLTSVASALRRAVSASAECLAARTLVASVRCAAFMPGATERACATAPANTTVTRSAPSSCQPQRSSSGCGASWRRAAAAA